jgi:hypothetical protein
MKNQIIGKRKKITQYKGGYRRGSCFLKGMVRGDFANVPPMYGEKSSTLPIWSSLGFSCGNIMFYIIGFLLLF